VTEQDVDCFTFTFTFVTGRAPTDAEVNHFKEIFHNYA